MDSQVTQEELQLILDLRAQAANQYRVPGPPAPAPQVANHSSSPSAHSQSPHVIEPPLSQPRFNPVLHRHSALLSGTPTRPSSAHSSPRVSNGSGLSAQGSFSNEEDFINIGGAEAQRAQLTYVLQTVEEQNATILTLRESVTDLSSTITSLQQKIEELEAAQEAREKEREMKRSRKPQKTYLLVGEIKNEMQQTAATALAAEVQAKITQLTSSEIADHAEGEEAEVIPPRYTFDFTKTATHQTNSRILERVVQVVSSIHRDDVNGAFFCRGVEFTMDDLRNFATTYYTTLKRSHEDDDDAERAARSARHDRTLRRMGRSRTRKEFLLTGKERYEQKTGKAVPNDAMDTDNMSEIVSCFDMSDLSDREQPESAAAKAARYEAAVRARMDRLEREYPHGGTVWEEKKKSFRSEEYLHVLKEMKECALQVRAEARSTKGKKKYGGGPNLTPSVNLRRTIVRAPWRPVYPFMISPTWALGHPGEARAMQVKPADPPGFGFAADVST